MTDLDTRYRKDLRHPAGYGFGRVSSSSGDWTGWRPGKATSIVVHSTNGNKGSTLAGEAAFLRDSKNVSCSDLIGKDGTIVEILPAGMVPWHAGSCKPQWANHLSIGIELHHAVGENYTSKQMQALTERVLEFIAVYHIPDTLIETHRFIALPAGRKVDPSDWSDDEFYSWRASLYKTDQPLGTVPVDPRLKTYWEKSGGIWQKDRFALGYGTTPLTNGVQLFERGALRLHPDGQIEGLLLSELV